jgi:hypothetical protein
VTNDTSKSPSPDTTAPAEDVHLPSEQLKRLDLIIMAIAGVLAGTILYTLGQIEAGDARQIALLGSTTFAAIASFIILWSRERLPERLVIISSMAALIGGITWLISGTTLDDSSNHFTFVFWVFPSIPLIGFLGMVFARVWLEGGSPAMAYPQIFRAGLNIPLQWGIGALLGGAVTLFVFLWAFAFEAAGWTGLKLAFDDGWIVLPLAGAITALATGLARALTRMRSALESIILIGAKIALPLLAVFSALFAIAVIIGGMESLKAAGSPTAILLSLAIAAKLIFNGVYRDGSRPPGPVMRSFVWITLGTLPVYALLAAHGIFIRVHEYGFTPSRFVVLTITGLIALYTILLLISLVGDILKRRRADWMPLVARLNTGFAALWMVLLISFQLPFLSPDVYSANDQTARLLEGRTPHDKFDYAGLRFEMGAPGRDAINALAELTDHPDAEHIRAAAADMRDRTARWVTPPTEPVEPEIDNDFSRNVLTRIEAINRIGEAEARASYLAAIDRRDTAQTLLCELLARDDISPAERQWAQSRMASDISYELRQAEHMLRRYPALIDLIPDEEATAVNRWNPNIRACEANPE